MDRKRAAYTPTQPTPEEVDAALAAIDDLPASDGLLVAIAKLVVNGVDDLHRHDRAWFDEAIGPILVLVRQQRQVLKAITARLGESSTLLETVEAVSDNHRELRKLEEEITRLKAELRTAHGQSERDKETARLKSEGEELRAKLLKVREERAEVDAKLANLRRQMGEE